MADDLVPTDLSVLFETKTVRGNSPGDILFDRFRLEKILGRGGMGVVWKAADLRLERHVAIKLLPEIVTRDHSIVSEMKREVTLTQGLNHPNIVRIYDFCREENATGIVMEYVVGQTLSALRNERPQRCFEVEEIAPWILQVCEVLTYAHTVGRIAHRDLKPANLMLCDGSIKVTDFSIALSLEGSANNNVAAYNSSGTVVYMSPQQMMGMKPSVSDDIYALGATIYDLLTGKPPFFSGNVQYQLEHVVPPTMTERRSELEESGNPIPKAWEKAVASCLKKNPAERPLSAQALVGLLKLPSESATEITNCLKTKSTRRSRKTKEPESVTVTSLASSIQSLSKQIDDVQSAFYELTTIVDPSAPVTLGNVKQERILPFGSLEPIPDDQKRKVEETFLVIRRRLEWYWRGSLAMTFTLFSIFIAMLILAIVCGIIYQRSFWSLIFGGTSVLSLLTVVVWKPMDKMLFMTIATQHLELIHFNYQQGLYGNSREREKAFREATTQLSALLNKISNRPH